ncbi:hypothetical protein HK105_207015 [Polyrhizophydium stewartii]|uniref:RING-type E3 ubiquitin transferase n=1 Tax=Polyrhizophydium stewartii TaxID=2732419 RepID=A0ABR4N223_9FUNG
MPLLQKSRCRFQHIIQEVPVVEPAAAEVPAAAPAADAARARPQAPARPPPPEAPDEPVECAICYETPKVFGIQSNCDHPFCLECIRKWRAREDKEASLLESGTNKLCPVCRKQSDFVLKSKRFIATGIEKDHAIASFMDYASSIPCRYFAKSLQQREDPPRCPHGNDCFYAHNDEHGNRMHVQKFEPSRLEMLNNSNRRLRTVFGFDEVSFRQFHRRAASDAFDDDDDFQDETEEELHYYSSSRDAIQELLRQLGRLDHEYAQDHGYRIEFDDEDDYEDDNGFDDFDDEDNFDDEDDFDDFGEDEYSGDPNPYYI